MGAWTGFEGLSTVGAARVEAMRRLEAIIVVGAVSFMLRCFVRRALEYLVVRTLARLIAFRGARQVVEIVSCGVWSKVRDGRKEDTASYVEG